MLEAFFGKTFNPEGLCPHAVSGDHRGADRAGPGEPQMRVTVKNALAAGPPARSRSDLANVDVRRPARHATGDGAGRVRRNREAPPALQIWPFTRFPPDDCGGLLVVLSRNFGASVLWLIQRSCPQRELFVPWGNCAMRIIVYVGAVAVLFLFVVMMLDVDFES